MVRQQQLAGRIEKLRDRAAEALRPRVEANARRMPSQRLPVHRVVISPSDPEAALGPDKFKTFRPRYNALTVSDNKSPLVTPWITRERNAGNVREIKKNAWSASVVRRNCALLARCGANARKVGEVGNYAAASMNR